MLKKGRKTVLATGLVLCSLLSSCAREKDPGAVPETVSPEPAETPKIRRFSTEEARVETGMLAELIKVKDWQTLQQHARVSLKELENQLQDMSLADVPVTLHAFHDEERMAGYADFGSRVRVVFHYDSEFFITAFMTEPVPLAPVPDRDAEWTEQLVMIGNEPQLYGLLTVPADRTNAPVAVLLPENLDAGIDSSGQDSRFRRELAHELAARGVAVLRWEMRRHADPAVLMNDPGMSLDRAVLNDLAAAVHGMEKLPVDPTDITLIGIGESAVLAAASVYNHFEITGGLVLMALPQETGVDYFAKQSGLPEEDLEELKQMLADDELPDLWNGWPASAWKQWDEQDQNRYMKYIKAPVLLLHGELSGGKEAWAYWQKELKNRSRTILQAYEELDDHLRDEDGILDEDALDDLAYWIRIGTLPERKKP